MCDQTIPEGQCECGCGRSTTPRNVGYARFVQGHHRRRPGALVYHRQIWANAGIEYGLCLCGCGRRTPFATYTDTCRNRIVGEPIRYIGLHSLRKSSVEFVEEDRGFLSACWVWQLALTSDGYACDSNGRVYSRNYVQVFGEIPEGLELDHLCRVRACVRPDHLEPVTHLENVRRGARAKLTIHDARTIRSSPLSQKQLAEAFGVDQTTISSVLRHKTWRET